MGTRLKRVGTVSSLQCLCRNRCRRSATRIHFHSHPGLAPRANLMPPLRGWCNYFGCGGAAGLTNIASSMGAFSFTSSILMVKLPLGRAIVQ